MEQLVISDNMAYATNPTNTKLYLRVNNKLVEIPANTKIRINSDPIYVACVGDSLTAGHGGTPYPEQLQEFLGDMYVVENFGVNAAKVLKDAVAPYCVYASTENYQKSLKFEPDIVIIMLGTNDNQSLKTQDAKDEFKNLYKNLIKSYQSLSSQPAVYLATSPYSTDLGINQNISETVVQLQKQIADEMQCNIIDIYGMTYNKNDLYSDVVHLNTDGYALIAQTIGAKIKKYTPPASVILETPNLPDDSQSSSDSTPKDNSSKDTTSSGGNQNSSNSTSKHPTSPDTSDNVLWVMVASLCAVICLLILFIKCKKQYNMHR